MIVFIDSGVLGLLTNPKKEGKPAQCEDWLYSLLAKGVYVVSSDICDYEVRRSLLLESAKKNSFHSLNNLDELRNVINFLSLETEVIFKASQIWMETRKSGRKTADNYSIDIDIIILAHWYLLRQQYPSRYLVIATTNVRHFEGFAEALNWEDINLY
jgi:predicted nucleic acid-binding protein